MFAVIHSDDIKAAGSSEEIMEAFTEQAAKIWKIKITDPSWALGLEEVLEVDEEGIMYQSFTRCRLSLEAWRRLLKIIYLPRK